MEIYINSVSFYAIMFLWWIIGYILILKICYEISGFLTVKDFIVCIIFGFNGLLNIPYLMAYGSNKFNILDKKVFEKKD